MRKIYTLQQLFKKNYLAGQKLASQAGPAGKTMGELAETVAVGYLREQGLSVITTNYRCRVGEIDIIANEQQRLVFVEVRYRKSAHYGGGAATVTPKKQRKLMKTANLYLQQHRANVECWFDVIEMSAAKASSKTSTASKPPAPSFHIHWIKNAFM